MKWCQEKGRRAIATPVETLAAWFAQLACWHTNVSDLSIYQTTELNDVSKPSRDDDGIRRTIIFQKLVTQQTRIYPGEPQTRKILSGLSFPTEVRRSCGSCSLSPHSGLASGGGLVLRIPPPPILGVRFWDDDRLHRWPGFQSVAYQI